LIPLLAYKDNKFAKYHGKQGLIFLIAYMVIFIVLIILDTFLFFISLYAGQIFKISFWLLGLVVLVFSILGIIKSLQGEYWKMPIIVKYVEKVKME